MQSECAARCAVTETSIDHEGNIEECGCEVRCWCFRTKRRRAGFFSCLNNPTGALVFLSTVAFLEGMIVNGLYNVSVTTLEKRFGLRSFETGLITSVLDIAGCAATLVTSYVGGAGHKPLWIGSGVLIMGVGSVLFSMPHFLAPAYSPIDVGSFNCSVPESCGESSLRSYRGFFFMGFTLIGVGATPLYTLAISYLDENVEQARSALFSGVFFACALLGPGVGFIIGGYMLKFFTTMGEPSIGITDQSPAWIGNWWLGFVLVGGLYVLLSVPLFLYPERIPGTAKYRANRENEIQHCQESMKAQLEDNFGKSIKDAPRSMWILLKNRTVMLISFATAVDSGLLIGLATFGPKYIESMFSLTASDAGFYFGAVAIACASSGHLISGFLISKFHLTVTQMLRMCLVTSIVSCGCYFVFLRRCDNPDIVGAFIPYPGRDGLPCNVSACDCRIDLFRPVCGSNNLTYLSFCDAGCEAANDTAYVNCSKIDAGDAGVVATATGGICDTDRCPSLAMYLFIIGVAVFLTFFNAQPALQCSLRVVLFSQRAFCLGFQWMTSRLLGAIPIPIIYGKVLDLTCQVWGEECGQCSSCHVYDNLYMSQYLAWLCIVLKGIGLLCVASANIAYKPSTSREKQTSEPNGREQETVI